MLYFYTCGLLSGSKKYSLSLRCACENLITLSFLHWTKGVYRWCRYKKWWWGDYLNLTLPTPFCRRHREKSKILSGKSERAYVNFLFRVINFINNLRSRTPRRYWHDSLSISTLLLHRDDTFKCLFTFKIKIPTPRAHDISG